MISEISGKVLLLAVLLFSMQAGGAPNPVLPRAADSGVLYFNGHYYLMGFCTDGAFYKSQNLVDWNGPHHAFSMNNEWATGEAGKDTEIHACDIAIHNGQFNLYWSVNYGELRAVGRAVSDTILGPYYEPEQKHPFDGRIDPHLFRDTDGRCYFYTVKFTEGNVIYGQAMSGPDALIGEAKSLLSAVPHTWEFMDHKVNEGPCVIRYRDRCFMLYNGNHTGLSYGNYGIGCAVSDAPLAFNNDTKYPFPLLRTNWDRIYENSRALSPISREEGVLWKFTDTPPADTWAAPMYDDSEWTVKEGSFGNQKIFMLGGTLRSTWNSSEIWTRRKFMVEEKIIAEDLYVFINHDADAEVFLNGVLACCVSGFSGGYKLKSVTAKATETLHQGENVLAVHCTHDDVGAQYIDAGLYLFPPNHAEIAIENCGQPNLVRGPNGFEWWLVYFAVYDGNPMRSQGIDRVHFFDKELVMMPPTSPNTPGEWQLPSAPTFSDTFDETDMAQVWTVDSGSWNIKQGTLTQDENASIREIHLNLPPQRHYLFETGLLFSKNTTGQAGIKVGEQGVYIGLDRAENTWYWKSENPSAVCGQTFSLPETFNWDGWHSLRLVRNANTMLVYLDTIPAPGNNHITPHTMPSEQAGLFVSDTTVSFDGIVYTAGWDEYDEHICGWEDSLEGTVKTGAWTVNEKGLSVGAAAGEAHSFKGDLLEAFEWSVQVIADSTSIDAKAESGVYGLYCDSDNFLRIALSANGTTVHITGRSKGVAITRQSAPVFQREPRLLPVTHSGINLRVVRADGAVILYVDGRESITLTDTWSAAQVGLFTCNTSCRFNGITLFDRNDNRED